MAYPFDGYEIDDKITSIDKSTEAEAGIISCMSDLFYNNTDSDGTLVANIETLLTGQTDPAIILPVIEQLKQILCAYACKEAALAEVVGEISYSLAVEKGLIRSKC